MSRTITLKKKIERIRSENSFFHRHAFGVMNFSQMLSVFNDNFFKFLTIYYLLAIKGIDASSEILFWIGVLYVLPFLVCSSFAGMLSDKFSKSRLFIGFKAFETVILIGAYIAYANGFVFGCYAGVFLLSLQSALISPPKYAMIPELVKPGYIPKANGYLTSASYLAIIFGTFAASLVTDFFAKDFVRCLHVAMLASVCGLISSFLIPYTEPGKSTGKANILFFVQTYRTLKASRKTPKLVLMIIGSAFFLFVGAFLQLNAIPYAIESLSLSEQGGGYLFVGTSVGIAIGAMLAGRLCRKEIDLGLALFGIMTLGIILIFTPFFATSVTLSAIFFMALGLCGGLFVVPLESFIQTHSPSEMRGQIVATENFLSFTGVLLAPFCLFLFSKGLRVSALSGFILLGFIIFGYFVLTLRKLSSHFFHFLSLRFLHPLYNLHYIDYPQTVSPEDGKFALVFKTGQIFDVMLLAGETSKAHYIYVKSKPSLKDRLTRLFGSIRIVYEHELGNLDLNGLIPKGGRPYILFESVRLFYLFEHHNYFAVLEQGLSYQLRQVELKATTHMGHPWTKLFKRSELTYRFAPLKKTFISRERERARENAVR